MPKPCPFCAIAAGSEPAHIILEDDDSLAFLDRRPLFHGHVLLIPCEHVETLPDLPPPLLPILFGHAQRLCRAVEDGLDAQGAFLAINNRISQSVPHLHIHIVPRRKGDGLKGFFWPRHPYASDEQMADFARRIREALE